MGMSAIGDTIEYLRGWSIKKIITVGCTNTILTTGAIVTAVAVDKTVNGHNATNVYDAIVPWSAGVVYESSRIMTGIGITGVNNIVSGVHDGPGLSDQTKEDIKTVKDTVTGVVKDVFDGTMNGLKAHSSSILLIGMLGTAAVVIENQSKFNWAGVSDRPAKRMKK
jgi:hypothetical protein